MMRATARVIYDDVSMSEGRLHDAAQHAMLGAIGEVLRSGTPVNCTDAQGHTALHLAAREGHVDAAMVLLTAGADSLPPRYHQFGD
ncbi:MAG: ankyrin repeat domain-containing protein [Armatimonadota bacterium]